MNLATDLLEQAQHLARRERKRPRQASLRRAVSAAYYALFHRLVAAACAELLPGVTPTTRALLARSFDHGEMMRACRPLVGGTLPAGIVVPDGPPSPELRQIAEAFVELQQARHSADYDSLRRFTRAEAVELVKLAGRGIDAWGALRKVSPQQARFLLVLLLTYSRTRAA